MILDAPNIIGDTIDMNLNGGNFHTGNAAGNTEILDNLTLSAASSIGLGTGSHTLTFSDGSGIDTFGLTITGWEGTGANDSSGTAGQIFFTSSNFSAGELAAIYFDGYGVGARQIAGGEIVPDLIFGTDGVALGHACFPLGAVPEPSTWFAGIGLLSIAFWHARRRRRNCSRSTLLHYR